MSTTAAAPITRAILHKTVILMCSCGIVVDCTHSQMYAVPAKFDDELQATHMSSVGTYEAAHLAHNLA